MRLPLKRPKCLIEMVRSSDTDGIRVTVGYGRNPKEAWNSAVNNLIGTYGVAVRLRVYLRVNPEPHTVKVAPEHSDVTYTFTLVEN